MRDLDAKLATGLGLEVIEIAPGYVFIKPNDNESLFRKPLPCYSEDGNDMLELIDEMLGRGWKIMTIYSYGEYTVYFENSQAGIKVTAKHTKLVTAVALAAYKSLTGKGWTDGQ